MCIPPRCVAHRQAILLPLPAIVLLTTAGLPLRPLLGKPQITSAIKTADLRKPRITSSSSEPFRTKRDPTALNRTQPNHDFFKAVADGADTNLASFAPFALRQDFEF